MIYGLFHSGSGLGNQLFRYVATRIKAQELGVGFGMIAPDLFKGSSFMNLDMGESFLGKHEVESMTGKVIPENIVLGVKTENKWEEWNKFTYDPDFNFIEDNTIIDGSFEDERYFGDHLPEISEWLKTEPFEIPNNFCVIGFRGGEYYTVPELGLPKEYYDRAIAEILRINPDMKFEVHTDDLELARKFFPTYNIFRNIEDNWKAVRYAKYAIIANSSFYVLPRLLAHKHYLELAPDAIEGGEFAITIAPRYWNRYNTKKWDYPQGYYKSFKYI